MIKKIRVYLFLAGFFSVVVFLSFAYSHCEIPCGIYGDRQRIEAIQEDINTIEKSMEMIIKLSKEGSINYNQLVRWVNNKDAHADNVQDVVFKYFMAQRIIPADPGDKEAIEKYNRELRLLHLLAVTAMKSKQTTDLSFVKKMRELSGEFSVSYFRNGDKNP